MAGLYIHIPYCVKKCLYCDFVSYAMPGDIVSLIPYLCKEMQIRRDQFPADQTVDSVFVGGGTPSLLDGEAMSCLLAAVRHNYEVSENAEITVECNPGTLTQHKLEDYRRAGVNRLSIGLQSADEMILKTLGRIHTYDDFCTSMRNAYQAGFENINVDVMHGLPGQTQQIYLNTLEKVTSFPGVKHISSYMLILGEDTPLYSLVSTGKVSLPSDDETADMDDAGIEFLQENGYLRYEISNFSLDGYRCRHNVNYWQNGTYLGIGPAAHGTLRIEERLVRYENMNEIKTYCKRILTKCLPESNRSVIPEKEEMFETVMLALRMTDGLDTVLFNKRFGIDFETFYRESIRNTIEKGWGNLSNNRFCLTKRGLDMQNSVLVSFMEEKSY